MKVIFDGCIFASQRYGGVSRYAFELANALYSLDTNISILSPVFVNEYLRQSRPNFLVGSYLPYIPYIGFIRRFLNTALSNIELTGRADKVDLIHETYYSRYMINVAGARRVSTVYDMIHEIYPKFFSRFDGTRSLKRKTLDRSDLIVCISQSTKYDLLKFIPDLEDRVEVVYPGFTSFGALKTTPLSNLSEFHVNAIRFLEKCPPYLLYLGQRNGYKNFRSLLFAFERSKFLKDNFIILCFGGGKLSRHERMLISRLQLSSNIRFMSGNDQLLMHAYKNAWAFVYPSLYEGFGIPPLEAMSMDCPVICSRASSIPEVVGEAGVYFDPNNVDDISQQLENVSCSSEIREDLIRKGKTRYPQFSWENSAERTLSLYKRVLRA